MTCLANAARSSPAKELVQLPWKEEGRALHPAAVSEAAMDARTHAREETSRCGKKNGCGVCAAEALIWRGELRPHNGDLD